MKRHFITAGLAAGLTAQLFAGETLRLKIEPDREYLLRGSPQEVVVKIDLSAVTDTHRRHRRTPLNLAVVLDRSGSMSGAKIEQARQAAIGLVNRLEPDDIFSLVAYDDKVKVLVSAQRVENKEALRERIAALQPGGSTALYAGVKTGAEQLREYLSSRRINRVMLLSDGLANVGPSSTRDLRQLGRQLSEEGIAVTTIGLGDDYNEDLMAGLAEASDANYYYVKDTEKLPAIFAKELGELLTVCARDVRIEIICPEGVRPIGFIGRSEEFRDQQATVKLSHFTAGQDRCLFLRCLVEKAKPEIARVKITYTDELEGGSERTASAAVSVRFTEDKVVALNSVRASVVAEKELVVTAVAKDKALADADAGNYRAAALKLESQAVVLEKAYVNAPAAVQIQIRQEVDNLRSRRDQISNGEYDAATRKSMQSESYNTRNSKW